MLSVAALGVSETHPKLKRRAYAAEMLLASYFDELVILCCEPSSAAGTMPRRGWPDNYRWGPGSRGKGWDRLCTGLWLGLSQSSEVVPPGRQMEDYVNWSCSVKTAQSHTPEKSNTWDLKNPELALPNRKTECIISHGALHVWQICYKSKLQGHQAVSMVLCLIDFNVQHELFDKRP